MKEKYEDKDVWVSVAQMAGARCDSGGTDRMVRRRCGNQNHTRG